MTDLSPNLPKLSRLVPRLSSNADSEVVATVRKIGRILRGASLDWHELTSALAPVLPGPVSRPQPQPHCRRAWLKIANWCALYPQAGTLSTKEINFVLSMVRLLRRYCEPTEKQAKWLRSIEEKLGEAS